MGLTWDMGWNWICIVAHGITANVDEIIGCIKRCEEDEPTAFEEALAYQSHFSGVLYTQDYMLRK